MSASNHGRVGVLYAMPTIRLLFAMRCFEVEPFSDTVIADALLETCPPRDDLWLSKQHFASAADRLTAAMPRR